MLNIPVVLNHEDDEMLASWIIRLAHANAIDSTRAFLNAYIYPNKEVGYTSMKIDHRIPFVFLSRALSLGEKSMRDLFFETSTFNATAPLMSSTLVQRYVNQAFNPNEQLRPLYPLPHGTIDSYIVCPECIREELHSRGYYYLHRAHHIPGVKVCYKHGCALGKVGSKFINLDIYSEPKYMLFDIQNASLAKEYALYAKAFMDAQVEGPGEIVRELILHRYTKETTKTMLAAGYGAIVDKNLDAFFQQNLKSHYPSINTSLAALMFLFRDVQEVKDGINGLIGFRSEEHDEQLQEYSNFIEREGYKVLGNFRRDLLELKHLKCGTRFCVSFAGFQRGWRCPYCDREITLQKKYEELVNSLHAGTYVPLDQFKSMDTPASFRHKCGRVIQMKPREFLDEGQECDCLTRVQFKDAAERVEAYEGFTLVNYIGTESKVKIRHSCGNEFEVLLSKFEQSPFCRVCERREHLRVRTTDDLISDIVDLVGDEYTLLSEYINPRTKVLIRHNKCGNAQKYKPYDFLDGRRCKSCHIELTEREFENYVFSRSKGTYAVRGKATKNLYEIVNTKTGRSVRLTMEKTRQELQRHVPSKLLPVPEMGTEDPLAFFTEEDHVLAARSERIRDQIIKFIQEYYKHEPVFLEDVAVFFGNHPRDAIQSAFSNLTRAGIITRLATGVYSLPGNDFSSAVLVEKRYICRNGRRIGFYRGKSFAYELGLESVRPTEWSIATNKESFKTPNRKTTFLGEIIHVKGSKTEINDNNYVLLSIVDFLIQYKQITSASEDEVLQAIREYIKRNNDSLKFDSFAPIIDEYRTPNIRVMMNRLITSLFEVGSC